MFNEKQIDILNKSSCFPLEEGIRILSQHVGIVRKEHMCWNCNEPIKKSEQVIIGKAIVDGDIFTGYICNKCCGALLYDKEHPEDCEHFMDRWV